MIRTCFLVSLLAFGAGACAPQAAADVGKPDMVLTIDELGSGFAATGLLIVRLDSGNCQPCRVLDDAFDAVVQEMRPFPYLFVVLDLTDQETTGRSMQLADEMGVRAIVEGRLGDLGSVLLIDTRRKVVVDTLQPGVSVEDFSAAVQSASPTGAIGMG